MSATRVHNFLRRNEAVSLLRGLTVSPRFAAEDAPFCSDYVVEALVPRKPAQFGRGPYIFVSLGDICALTLKRYLAPDNWYVVEYPENWMQELDEDGVPEFWNTSGGLGILRLRGYKFKDAQGSPAPALGLLDDVTKKTAGSERVRLGGRVAVHATSTGKLTPTDDLTTVHNWYLVAGAIALIVTYTLPTRDASTPMAASELSSVLKILSSVQFENESSRTSD